METLREPTNKNDHDAQYENIIAWLVKAAAPSNVLGYAANLYRHANRWLADRELEKLKADGEVEPKKPKEIFVWGACDKDGSSWIYIDKPHEHPDGISWSGEGDYSMLDGKDLFPNGSPQKYYLIPVFEIPLPKT